jgi:restriction endonuclease Mrr
MDEYEFEQFVADLWEERGWNAAVTRGSSDKGVDVVAIKEDPFEQRQLIQAKRYASGNNVGSGEIQKYSGLYARDEQVDAVVVVTTSGFTSEAKSVAKNRDVKIVDGKDLMNIIKKYSVD